MYPPPVPPDTLTDQEVRERTALAPRWHVVLLDDNEHTYAYVEMLGAIFGRKLGALLTGGLGGGIVWLLTTSLMLGGLAGVVVAVFALAMGTGGGRRGGWGGGPGGFGGGGGWSSGGGGWSSGGGGDFGGGGASGRW